MDSGNIGAMVSFTINLGTSVNVGDIVRFQFFKSQDITPDSTIVGMPYSENSNWIDYNNYFIQDYQVVVNGGNTFSGSFWADITPARVITVADFWSFQVYTVIGSTPAPTAQPATTDPIKPNLAGPIYAYDSCRPGTAMLTFDDGPGVTASATSKVLDALAKSGAKATFFLAPGDYDSNLVNSKANLVRRMYAEGHFIGCHSWNHPDFTSPVLSISEMQTQQMDPCQSWVQSILPGYVVTHWRPPYGKLTNAQAEYVSSSQGYIQAYWNVYFQDINTPGEYSHHKTVAINYFTRYKNTFGQYPESPVFLLHDEAEYNAVDPVTGQHFIEWLVNYFGPSGMGYNFIKGDECYNTCPQYEHGGFCSDQHYVHANWCKYFPAYQRNSNCGKLV